MSGRLRTAAVAGASALAVGAVVFALVSGWSAVRRYDWTIRPAWAAGAFAALMLAFLGAAIMYARLIVRLHPAARPQASKLERGWALSMLGRYVPGNMLMVAGRLELARTLGVPRRVALAASVYEQVLTLATSALAALLYFGLYGDIGLGAVQWLLFLVPLIPIALHPKILGPMSSAALRRMRREPLTILLSPGQTAAAFAWYTGVQILIGLGAWMLVRAAAATDVGPVFVGLAFLLAFTVSMLAFVLPSGLGVREGVLALALAPRLPGGVAVAMAIGLRFAFTIIELCFVAVMTSVWRRRSADYPVVVPNDARWSD